MSSVFRSTSFSPLTAEMEQRIQQFRVQQRPCGRRGGATLQHPRPAQLGRAPSHGCWGHKDSGTKSNVHDTFDFILSINNMVCSYITQALSLTVV